jgi:peptide/nickel transport system substrate-binding protein
MAEERGETAFSEGKADTNEVDWLSYISGPTVDFLRTSLAQASEENYIPYEATLGEFITADEATDRWANITEWERSRGHFWIGTGAYFLQRAFPVEGNVILQRNPDFPDNAAKWDRFAAPAIAEVEVDGPTRVTIGEEAVFEVFVSFDGHPMPSPTSSKSSTWSLMPLVLLQKSVRLLPSKMACGKLLWIVV